MFLVTGDIRSLSSDYLQWFESSFLSQSYFLACYNGILLKFCKIALMMPKTFFFALIPLWPFDLLNHLRLQQTNTDNQAKANQTICPNKYSHGTKGICNFSCQLKRNGKAIFWLEKSLTIGAHFSSSHDSGLRKGLSFVF